MLTLYDGTTSVCAIKVRLVLAEKGLAFTSKTLDLRAGEQFEPDYLKLNPGAVVPTLIDDDYVVIESSIIQFYLEDRFPEPTLLPSSAQDRVRMRHWMKRIDVPTHPDCGVMTHATAFRASFRTKTEAEQEAHFAAMPDPGRRDRQREVYAQGLDAPIVIGAVRRFDALLRDMDKALQTAMWLAGPNYSLADAAATPYADRLAKLSLLELWRDSCPSLMEWYARVRRRRSYRRAISDYFTETDAAHLASIEDTAVEKVRSILAA